MSRFMGLHGCKVGFAEGYLTRVQPNLNFGVAFSGVAKPLALSPIQRHAHVQFQSPKVFHVYIAVRSGFLRVCLCRV